MDFLTDRKAPLTEQVSLQIVKGAFSVCLYSLFTADP